MAVEREIEVGRDQAIVRDPGILGGEPVVKGSRIAVRSIVRAFEIYGERARALRAYPSLQLEQIDAAMHYYDQNRDLIRRSIEENEAAAFAQA